MTDRAERSAICRADVIHAHRTDRGFTIEQLAKKAQVSARTISRMLKGVPVDFDSIERVATALRVRAEVIREGSNALTLLNEQHLQGAVAEEDARGAFVFHLTLRGEVTRATGATELARLVPELIAQLQRYGLTLRHQDSKLLLTEELNGFRRRLVVLHCATAGGPFHVHVGIRPTHYERFVSEVTAGHFRPEALGQYGEYYDHHYTRSCIETLLKQPIPELAAEGRDFRIEGPHLLDLPPELWDQYDREDVRANRVPLVVTPVHLDYLLKHYSTDTYMGWI